MNTILKVIIGAIFLIVFLIPGYTFFFVNQEPLQVLNSNASLSTKLYVLFRLFGLYGFTFIWSQIVLGPFRNPLTRIFGPIVLKLHITGGIFALTFATLHPLLFYLAYYLATKNAPAMALLDYLGEDRLIFGLMGMTAWILMITTVATAILRNNPWFVNKWRYIHFLNYLIFILVFIHSFNIGSDVRLEPLNTLYGFFGLTFILAVVYRVGYRRIWTLYFKKQTA